MENVDLPQYSELIKKGIVICRRKRRAHPFGIFYGQDPLEYSFPLALLQVSTLIIITRLLRFLLKPLRQPRIISDILGGIVIGPSILGRSKKAYSYIFPDNAIYVIKNIGLLGFMYFLFLYGVKIDVMVISRARRKHWYIALIGVVAPVGCTAVIGYIERKSLSKQLWAPESIWGIGAIFSASTFPVLYPILRELNLLSSWIGRMALTTSVAEDFVIGTTAILTFQSLGQLNHRPITALWYVLSFVVILAILCGLRYIMLWIVRITPEGKQVDQIYVIAILLGVMVAGFITDMVGLSIANGPLWLGLAVPHGPPLGAILVEKSEAILKNILMPFSFMYIGIFFDVYSMSNQWSQLKPILWMVLGSYIVKQVSVIISARFFNLTIRDSLTLCLIMSLKGEVELLWFLHLLDLKIIGKSQYTLMVLLAASMTALATPLICILYDPTRPYMLNKRRNIQHTPPNTELHVVVGIHGEENLSGLMKLLEVSNPTVNSPLSVYALYLVELEGRSNPILIDHANDAMKYDQSASNSIHNALKIFGDARDDCMKMHSYTTITSKKSMYQDICELAFSKKACLIILPLHKQSFNNINGTRTVSRGFHSVNSYVLKHAPCSVGIVVDKTPWQNLVNGLLRSSMRRLALLFLGGADAREALTYADRMAECSYVSLTVVRYLSQDGEGDDEMEKKLDDGLVTRFWVKSEGNNRISYREVFVKNGQETLARIQEMDKESYDLWIMGRKHGINSVLLQGLSCWSENNELGVIGDYVASADFGSSASVLSVQQQILRGQGKANLLGDYCKFCAWKP